MPVLSEFLCHNLANPIQATSNAGNSKPGRLQALDMPSSLKIVGTIALNQQAIGCSPIIHPDFNYPVAALEQPRWQLPMEPPSV